ncbi:MAG: hypothetical protein ACOVP7_11325 [Lacibacter sp.]
MKKIISFLLFFVSVALVHAQKRISDSATNKLPVLIQTNAPVKNASKVIPTYPDIIVTALTIQKNGIGYYANYTLKNTGNAPVKKGWLHVQGYINTTAGACGGSGVVSSIAEKEQLLNPGESISGTQKISLAGLTVGNTYTYIFSAMQAIKLDEGKPTEKWVSSNNKFEESDITNNQKRINFVLQL